MISMKKDEKHNSLHTTPNTHSHILLKSAFLSEPNNSFSCWTWDKPMFPVFRWQVGEGGISISICAKSLQSCLTLCDPMDYIAHQALLSMRFSRQEYCSELPFPSPGDLPNPGIEPTSPVSCICRQLPSSTTWEAPISTSLCPSPGLTNSSLTEPASWWNVSGQKESKKAELSKPVLWDLWSGYFFCPRMKINQKEQTG